MSDFIYESLDSNIQFEIYNQIVNRMEELQQVEKFTPMEKLMQIIEEETNDALAKKAGSCEKCNCPADQMEWQEFDKIFICPSCGNDQ